MIPERFSAADVDGTLCIKWETASYLAPEIITNYWPTVKTMDFLRWLTQEDATWVRDNWDKLIAELQVSKTMAGEYFIGRKQYDLPIWKDGQHICLANGAKTPSIKTEIRLAPVPKVRKGTMIYWSGGNWVKHLKSGREVINPLTIAG